MNCYTLMDKIFYLDITVIMSVINCKWEHCSLIVISRKNLCSILDNERIIFRKVTELICYFLLFNFHKFIFLPHQKFLLVLELVDALHLDTRETFKITLICGFNANYIFYVTFERVTLAPASIQCFSLKNVIQKNCI